MFSAWSDGFYTNDAEHWFIGGDLNALFRASYDLEEYEFITDFPDYSADGFRINPICVQCNEMIFCFPDRGDSIWVYRQKEKKLLKLAVHNPEQVRIGFIAAYVAGSKIFAISLGLCQIVEIDAEERKLVKYHTIKSKQYTGRLMQATVRNGKFIYCFIKDSQTLCEFNTEDGHIGYYDLPMIKTNIYTICFDGKKFWMGGSERAVYIWDKEDGSIQVMDNFPDSFGVYVKGNDGKIRIVYSSELYEEPVFYRLIYLNNEIWCIPYCSNEILYIDKNTHRVSIFDIPNEEENSCSWNAETRMLHKYHVEYVRENRYLGLYSLKNRSFFEIDVVTKASRAVPMKLREDDRAKLWNLFIKNKLILREHTSSCLEEYIDMCKREGKCDTESITDIGKKIYQELSKD